MLYPNDAETTAYICKFFIRKNIPCNEDGFIQVLSMNTSSNSAVYWAVLGLRDCGTSKCIPSLKAKLHHPSRDVKDCSILTIAHIAGATETDFYIEALRDKKTQKSYPLWAICDAADERAIVAVLEYMVKLIRKLKEQAINNDSYYFGMKYLLKCRSHDVRIEHFFHEINRRFGILIEVPQNAVSKDNFRNQANITNIRPV